MMNFREYVENKSLLAEIIKDIAISFNNWKKHKENISILWNKPINNSTLGRELLNLISFRVCRDLSAQYAIVFRLTTKGEIFKNTGKLMRFVMSKKDYSDESYAYAELKDLYKLVLSQYIHSINNMREKFKGI